MERNRTGETSLAPDPCPRCGNKTVIIVLLVDEDGHHQHTRYICTFFGSLRGASCGWSGWTMPEIPESEH